MLSTMHFTETLVSAEELLPTLISKYNQSLFSVCISKLNIENSQLLIMVDSVASNTHDIKLHPFKFKVFWTRCDASMNFPVSSALV